MVSSRFTSIDSRKDYKITFRQLHFTYPNESIAEKSQTGVARVQAICKQSPFDSIRRESLHCLIRP